jgi:hypothetical protein
MVRSVMSVVLAAAAAMAVSGSVRAQTLQALANQPPYGDQLNFQMTDGTVLAQAIIDTGRWFKLTPDINGSYLNGTWTEIKSLPVGYAPRAFASAVLADGRLVIIGGEYNYRFFDLTNKGAIYDPVAGSWTSLAAPPDWGYIGDSPSTVLPSGKYLLGDKLHKWIAALDPKTLTWTTLSNAGKNDFNAEEGWNLLPDGSVLTVDVKDAPQTERYLPGKQAWRSAGATPEDLVVKGHGKLEYGPGLYYHPPGEVGPAVLRPDGTVFATGARPKGSKTAHTAIYTPPSQGNPLGSWAAGPDFPSKDQAQDTTASLLPDGNVLVVGDSGMIYEFDGTNLTAEGLTVGTPGYSQTTILPTGQVIVGGSTVALYTPSGTYQASWAPTIGTYPATVTRGDTYEITGTQFNGLSQANAFGDEFQSATNYPLVRITNNATSHVFYARTHDHSTMAVATGSKIVSTNFDVPSNMETGASSLVVVTNGIPSQPVSITVD